MRSIAKRPTGRSLLLRAALAVGVLGALVGAASAVAASPTTPVTYTKAVCPTAKSGYARCLSYVVTNKAGAPLVSPNVVSGYGPVQFQTAYGLTAAAAASTNQIVAIVDAFDNPNTLSDLNKYSSTFGLPAMAQCSGAPAPGCFTKVNQTGGTSPPPGDTGWGLEIALDVETVHAVCPKCGILLVEANSNSFANLIAAEDYATSHATVVSNSWGGSEFSQETGSAYDGHFNRPGVAITVSSGDNGYGVEYPAASRYVTSVGGTHLVLDGGNNRSSETVWGCEPGQGCGEGAGSGCSAFESKPAWQTDSSCTRRTVADVSADADPATGAAVYDTYGQGGWVQVGGTSLAAPLIAAVYALAGTPGASDYPSSYPYAHTSSLFDVTSGTNGSCGGSYLCTGMVGYDGPTGLGTPNGTTAFASGGGGGGGGGSAPTVTSFSPTSGAVGASVTINGTNFTGVTAVKFNTTSATTYTVNSATKITATVPSGATTGPISVSNGSGTGTSATSFTVTGGGGGGGSAPTITSFSPTLGFTGTRVTINGTNFTGATSVKLGTVSASFTVTSATRISGTVPSMAGGNYTWQVTTPNGTATSTGVFHHF